MPRKRAESDSPVSATHGSREPLAGPENGSQSDATVAPRESNRRRKLSRPTSGRRRGVYLYVPAAELERAERSDATHYTVWGTERGGLLVRLYREGDKVE